MFLMWPNGQTLLEKQSSDYRPAMFVWPGLYSPQHPYLQNLNYVLIMIIVWNFEIPFLYQDHHQLCA